MLTLSNFILGNTDRQTRINPRKHFEPLRLCSLFDIMHRHCGNIPSSICDFNVRRELLRHWGDAVSYQNVGRFVRPQCGQQRLEKSDCIVIGPIPEHVANDVSEDLCGVTGGRHGRWRRNVGESNAILVTWFNKSLAPPQEVIRFTTNFKRKARILSDKCYGCKSVSSTNLDGRGQFWRRKVVDVLSK